MITFNFQYTFKFVQRTLYRQWIKEIVQEKNKKIGELNYIFCDDEYLIAMNQQYLQHDTYTDIITFDYCENDVINGDIFISVERVNENAQKYEVGFQEELLRVMGHGVLHLCGYKDKTKQEAEEMRKQEQWSLEIFEKIKFDNCKK